MGTPAQKNVSKIQTTYVAQQEYAEIASARKRKQVIRRLSVFFVFACLLSYLMISSFLSQTTKLEAKIAQKKQVDNQLADLKKERDSLKQEIINLNDDDYIAKFARKEFFFSKQNEVIFTIPDGKKEK
ncbi:septum formation initiator family protein [Paenibacillus sp. BSR1-1]|uniref:FtsB family cell division protein n=1 Tax=Paenibacillus sp. BSR1-1 TaxID=3020845 RepID=UPI0025B1DF64|nr:septum formation initiator family protein [Paenibacillus sp. BSR1-1]MDN3019978.1 septum formation initiator family protein [Paenibacillus sp. BSR1-1]